MRPQFASRSTVNFYAQLKIRQQFASVEHPQSNGQDEVANKVILRGLQRRFKEVKGRSSYPCQNRRVVPTNRPIPANCKQGRAKSKPRPTVGSPRSSTNKGVSDESTSGEAVGSKASTPTV
ncbi:hypothetical protein CR513_35365, partial [Mucuna pruriens]